MTQQLQIPGTEIEQNEQALINAWEELPKGKRQTLGKSLNDEAIRTCLGVMARIKIKNKSKTWR